MILNWTILNPCLVPCLNTSQNLLRRWKFEVNVSLLKELLFKIYLVSYQQSYLGQGIFDELSPDEDTKFGNFIWLQLIFGQKPWFWGPIQLARQKVNIHYYVLVHTEFNIFKGKVFPRHIFFKNQSLGRRLNIWSWQSLLWWLWMHTYL